MLDVLSLGQHLTSVSHVELLPAVWSKPDDRTNEENTLTLKVFSCKVVILELSCFDQISQT
jgi:hypothetical protein